MKNIIFIVFLLFSCKAKIDANLQNAIVQVLSENQKIHELLLSNQDNQPEVTAILSSVKEAKLVSEKNETIKKELEKLEQILININLKDREAYFESLSSFSETLTDILKVNNIETNYNKFYCPMVAKYWIAKGEAIENPYAPEMRDCGELVK